MKNILCVALIAGTSISGFAKYVPPGPEFYAPNYEVPDGMASEAQYRFKGYDVADVLRYLFMVRGCPEYIRSDYS